MEKVDPEALADVAYGLFEVMLNTGLREKGPYLFELVEKGIDFEAQFLEIFRKFCDDYPQLGEALIIVSGPPMSFTMQFVRGG